MDLPVCNLLFLEKSHSICNLQCKIVEFFVVEYILKGFFVLENRICGWIETKFILKPNITFPFLVQCSTHTFCK